MKAATAKTAFLFYLCSTFRVTWGQTTAMCPGFVCDSSVTFGQTDMGPASSSGSLTGGFNTPAPAYNDPAPAGAEVFDCEDSCRNTAGCVLFLYSKLDIFFGDPSSSSTTYICALKDNSSPFTTSYPTTESTGGIITTYHEAYVKCDDKCSFDSTKYDIFSGCNIMELLDYEPYDPLGTYLMATSAAGQTLEQCKNLCFANFDCQSYTLDNTGVCKTYNTGFNSLCQVVGNSNTDLYFIGNCDPKKAPGCGYKTKTNTGGDYGSYATKTNTAQTYKACWEWCRSEGRCRAHYWKEDSPGGSTGTCALHTEVTASNEMTSSGTYCAEYMCDCGMDPQCFSME